LGSSSGVTRRHVFGRVRGVPGLDRTGPVARRYLLSAKGELGRPLLARFRALLLATWHDLSDVRLVTALIRTTCPTGFIRAHIIVGWAEAPLRSRRRCGVTTVNSELFWY